MAVCQRVSLLVFGVLFVATSMSRATALDGLAGRKLLLEDYRPPQPNSPIYNNPLQVSTEKKMCGKEPCPRPPPAPVKMCGKAPCPLPPLAPVDNEETVEVFLDGNNAFEVIIPRGEKPAPAPVFPWGPSPAYPPCPEGFCDQALADDRDFGASHIYQVDYPQPGPSPTPDIHDYPPPAAWSLHDVACVAQCPDPIQVCLNGRCVDPPHVNSVIKALADDRDFGASHIDQVDYPQPGPSPTPDIHDYPPPAAWSLHDVACVAQCPDPIQVCLNGRCVDPPHVNSVIKALADDRDFGASHIDQVDYPQPGPSPTPDIHDYFPPAAWSLHDVACVAQCPDPIQVCLNGRCVDPPHVNSVIKALADDRDFGASHIDQADYPQPGPSPTPDIHDYPPPAAWSLHDVACVAQCPDPMQVCLNGRCVDPPHVDSVNRGFNRRGTVLP